MNTIETPTDLRGRPQANSSRSNEAPIFTEAAPSPKDQSLVTSAAALKDKVAIITGAVGNLGADTARLFQDHGARTVLVDRSQERVTDAFKTLAESPDHLLAGGVDLTDPHSLSKLMEQTLDQFGRVDILVNTVGGYRGGKPVHETDVADWDFLFGINLRTTLLCCQTVIPRMLKQSSGKIINVASRDALAGSAGYAAYSVSKSAVLRLTESLAAELKVSNINVNAIMPGTIDTPQNRAAVPNGDYAKWVSPEAIADVIAFLASDASRAINGAALPVYGKG
jgi:NAD(P)-dependent dehydrogenase (short-subunit alcohol dehydrogenase family)